MFYFEKYGLEDINFLASEKYTAFTYQIPQTMGEDDGAGRKIVKAGTVYPANDATAIGIVFNDVDVTAGDRVGSVIVEGWILEERLPEPVSTEAKTAMKQISFKEIV